MAEWILDEEVNMAEETIQIEIPLLLPGVEDEHDRCLHRLEGALKNQKGIVKAHLETEHTPVDLCLHYDPNLLSLAEVRRLAERAGAQIVERYHHAMLDVEGMDCSDCALVLEHGLERMDGVLAVNVNYPAQKMRVEYDSHKIRRGAIEKRVRSLGYRIPAGKVRTWFQHNRELISSLAGGVLLAGSWVGESFLGLPALVATGLYLLAYALGGWHVAVHAWGALRARRFDTDLLMLAAALGAAALGSFAEGALLLFLFSLGHALEERSLERARKAVRSLAELAPKTALVLADGETRETAVEDVRLDDVVVVRPGTRLPVDGEVASGRSAVDQSPVTGESMPVDKEAGDPVFAGTINGQGALQVRATRLAKDSTLARVMEMVEEAQTQKSPTQQLVERFERIFVPVVLGMVALVILALPLFGFPFRDSFLRGMTLLVAASPCALALGTPATILAGVAQAARNGVLVKGGLHLENLGRVKAMAFDKTGTITHGRPQVVEILAFGDGSWTNDEGCREEVLRLAAAVEVSSAHPLAQAIAQAAEERGLELAQATESETLTGRGARAKIDGEMILVGNPEWIEAGGVVLTDEVKEAVERLQAEAQTALLVSTEGVIEGMIGVADTQRADVKETLRALRSLGVDQLVMLTGDNPSVAAAIARQAGLSDYRAGLMPEDKTEAVKELLERYGLAAMVGDGVNDAPALANATVGIAMGGAGTDVALESADVALMGDDLSKLPFAVGLGRATRSIIAQNLAIALGVIGLLGIAALTGFVSIGVAVIFHEGSTLVVVANALRLLGYRE
jgi:Cd2+/Zn2+-exporting ATPase